MWVLVDPVDVQDVEQNCLNISIFEHLSLAIQVFIIQYGQCYAPLCVTFLFLYWQPLTKRRICLFRNSVLFVWFWRNVFQSCYKLTVVFANENEIENQWQFSVYKDSNVLLRKWSLQMCNWAGLNFRPPTKSLGSSRRSSAGTSGQGFWLQHKDVYPTYLAPLVLELLSAPAWSAQLCRMHLCCLSTVGVIVWNGSF